MRMRHLPFISQPAFPSVIVYLNIYSFTFFKIRDQTTSPKDSLYTSSPLKFKNMLFVHEIWNSMNRTYTEQEVNNESF